MRLHLRVQQVQLGLGEFLLGGGVRGAGLLAAAQRADAAGDRAHDRLGVLVVGAVVDQEPVAPRGIFGFADQGGAAAVLAGRHRRLQLVARQAEPQQRVPAPQRVLAVGARARHLGLHLQAVARALHLFDAGQFADRRVQQVEGFAGFQRDLDQPALAIAERVGIGAAGDQAHPVQVRERAGHHQRHRRHPGQHHREFELADQRDARIQRGDQQHRQSPRGRDAQDEEQLLEQGLDHAWAWREVGGVDVRRA